jgi:hypothetical protein
VPYARDGETNTEYALFAVAVQSPPAAGLLAAEAASSFPPGKKQSGYNLD